MNAISQATLLVAARPLLAQPATNASAPNALQPLPEMPELFSLQKEQWTLADRPFIERDAISGGPDLLEALDNIAYIANTLNGDPKSPQFGWQSSKIYRSAHNGASPTNTRVMEPVSMLVWAYTLSKHWNPYYRHPTLRLRLEAGINYWLSLQSKAGGFPEDGGAGTQSLPPTSFSLEFLVEMSQQLDKDGTVDAGLRNRLRAAVEKATEWAATDMGVRDHGYHFSNQYCGSLYAMWRLWEITSNPKWKQYFDARLDEWLANAQPSLFWMEDDGVETFGYSHVTEWELDRLLFLSKDPRILESFRKYFEWCGLNTVPENDGVTFLMDNVGHARTSANKASGEVGFYNHITTLLPNSQAFAYTYLMTDAEREAKVAAWFENPIPPSAARPGKPKAYHIFNGYPMYFEPHGFWTISAEQQQHAFQNLPTVGQPRFTRYFAPVRGNDHYLFARRPGVYATLHWGRPNGKQAKEIGLVWLPGFGTLLRSFNNNIDYGYCTRVGNSSTYKKSITDFKTPREFATAKADGSVTARDLEFTTTFTDIGVQKSFRIKDHYFEVEVQTKTVAVEQIPLYFDSTDTLTLDGNSLILNTVSQMVAGKALRVKRICGGETAQAVIKFDSPMKANLSKAYDIANGAIYLLSVDVTAQDALQYRVKLA
ncbi:hypothetical protein EON80_09615 [bacterium]|nr:MAG: hypothetical protein EON80_09615 [bacterium]